MSNEYLNYPIDPAEAAKNCRNLRQDSSINRELAIKRQLGSDWNYWQDTAQISCPSGPRGDLTIQYETHCAHPNCSAVMLTRETLYHRIEPGMIGIYDGLRGDRYEQVAGECYEALPGVKLETLLRQVGEEHESKLKAGLGEQARNRLKEWFGVE